MQIKPTEFELGLFDLVMALSARLVRAGVVDAGELAEIFDHDAKLKADAGNTSRALPSMMAASSMRSIASVSWQKTALVEGEVTAALRRLGGDV